jgi:hypothetical protein
MRSYLHLWGDERDHVGALRAAGRSMGAIGKALAEHHFSVSDVPAAPLIWLRDRRV